MLLIGMNVKAQYNLMPIAPPPNFSFNDLWHFNIFNSDSAANSMFYVSLRIFDGSNILKVKSNTSTIYIGPGSNYYNLANISQLQPFTTSYYDASILQQTISSGGIFPPGTYNIVYTLYGKFADGNFTPLAEEASEATVEAMWPPMLLSPADGDTIDTQYPLLTWTPAFSSGYAGLITYSLNLVELFPGQNAYQAIQSNPLYFTQSNIPITLLPYPPSAQLLDTSKTYAWQVHADAQGYAMGSSEVWTFTFKQPRPATEIPDSLQTLYHDVEDAYPSTFVITSLKRILFKFEDSYHQDADSLLTFALYKEGNDNPILTTLTCHSCIVVTQNIYHSIDLEDNHHFTPGFYLLKIYDSQNRAKYLRILYKDEN
jgi:hypothetical protein